MSEHRKTKGKYEARYRTDNNTIYCEKCKSWVHSKMLAFEKKIPNACGKCKSKNWWKP